MLVNITLLIALLLSIVVPFIAYALGSRSKKSFKRSLAGNLIAFFLTFLITTIFIFSKSAMAAGSASASGLGFIGAGLAVGLSGIGGGIAVSSAASAALGALSEDSSILGKSLIYVGLAEGVCLYGLVIAFMILSRLG